MARAIKDSGIEWIGEIPEDWSISRIKNVASLYTGNSIKDEHKDMYTDKIEAKPYIATKDIEAGSCVINYDNGLYVKHDDESFKIATKGSSLMCIEGGSAGRKKAFLEEDVAFVNKLCCLSPFNVNEKFLFQFICSKNFEDEFTRHISGLIGGVSVSALKNFNIALPSLPEQQKIADFLDEKCKHIDAVLEKTRASIDKYKQLKQSVITEAVTKGIRPNRPMKDSGIEWIGQIPEEWYVSKIKREFSYGSGLPITKENLIENGIPVISYGQIHAKFNTGVRLDDRLYRYVSDDYLETNSNSLVNKYDFIFADTSEDLEGCGNCAYISEQMTLFAGYHTIVLHSKNTRDNRYIAYLFKSTMWRNQITSRVTGIKVFSISKKILNACTLLLPSFAEQIEIANYLDLKCSEIDKLIDKKEQLIEELETYKKSLIYEYVTGKKEVC